MDSRIHGFSSLGGIQEIEFQGFDALVSCFLISQSLRQPSCDVQWSYGCKMKCLCGTSLLDVVLWRKIVRSARRFIYFSCQEFSFPLISRFEEYIFFHGINTIVCFKKNKNKNTIVMYTVILEIGVPFAPRYWIRFSFLQSR